MLLFGATVLTGWAQAACAMQDTDQRQNSARLFASAEPMEFTIHAAWRDIVRKKADQSPYPATLEFIDASGQTRTLALSVARRGITRQRVCDFPPIKLRLAGKTGGDSVFYGEKSLKMVTHCRKGERWEQYYVKEMLAYRIYNTVTERSFRVRPLVVTYLDSATGNRDGPHLAFLIEDDGAVARRNGLKKIKLAEIGPTQLEPLESSRFALFQYLIGNTDWAALSGPSEKCCHNSTLMGRDVRTGIYAVPYDFDSSGLVNASYAAPIERLPIRSVTERLYRGFCVHNATLEPARKQYLDTEAQILDIVRNENRLDGRNKQAALRYLGRFFDVMRSEREFAAEVTVKCRK
jgi:hypothetical protein